MSFSAGSGTPMIPVEEGKTSSARQSKSVAAAAQVARAASQAGLPAAQLALPALMATTRTWPPVARRCSLSTMQRRGDDAVGGEGRGGAGRRIGHDEGEVGAAAAFEAGLGGGKTEAARDEEGRKVAHGLNPFNLAGGLAMSQRTAASELWRRIRSEKDFLELRNVNVARGDRVVLHDVNLSIRAGEHVAILGPNGCGKSTLIMAMTCQLYPIVRPGMRVRIFGRERWDLTELRRHFGVVSAGPMGTELPGERTAVTCGLDAVIAGFFSASTLWPNLHVTEEMRERAGRRWSGWKRRILPRKWWAPCRRARSGAF